MAKANRKLSPEETASAALAVYDIKTGANINDVFKVSKIYNHFDFNSDPSEGLSKRFTARSGAFEFKSNTGFGVIAKGKGRFANDAILVCRGTAGGYDCLTDINTGIQSSQTGFKVHAGFNRTFNDFRPDIINFINTHRPNTVHCIGHSLGGALATLSADLVANKQTKAVLYTFGSPRVGMDSFANHMSLHNKIGVDNIHRVYHGGDPVAMLPLWPFMHVPQPVGECYIGKLLSFNPAQHLMKHYIDSVSNQTWETLRKPQPNWDRHVAEWVTSDKIRAFGGLNLYNLTMAAKAINLAIKEVVGSGIAGLGLAGIAGATTLDQLSLLLDRAASLSKDSESFIMNLMSRLLAMAGITIKKTHSLSHVFIQWVLKMLTLAVNRSVGIALQTVHMGA